MRRHRLPAVLGVALALPLLAYMSVGWFARYVADDYCWAGVLRTQGFTQSQLYWYTIYSPRYAFTFVVTLIELAGPAIVPFLPLVAVTVWVAALTWTLGQLGWRLVSAVLVAEAVAFATLFTAPDVAQSLYWQTGMLTYVLPLILMTLYVGWVARSVRHPIGLPGWILCGALTFVAGGLSETYLIPQNVALTLALVGAIWLRQWTAVPHLAAGLAGGVLALTMIVVAPATAGRVGEAPADLWLALSAAIATAAYQVARLVRYFPYIIVLCVGVSVVLTRRPAAVDWRSLGLVTACVTIVLPFCYFASFYASNGNPPARSLIVSGFILVCYLVFVGWAIAPRFQMVPRQAIAAATLLLALVPLAATLTILPERALAAEYAALWDVEDQRIRAARESGVRDLVVEPRPRYLGEGFVSTDRGDWFNNCVARYYGLDSIAASS